MPVNPPGTQMQMGHPQVMMVPPHMMMMPIPPHVQHGTPVPVQIAHPLQHQHSPPPPISQGQYLPGNDRQPVMMANNSAVAGPPVAQPSSSGKTGHELFVGDLSYFCEEHHLFDLFKGFGVVTETRVKRNDRGGRTLMYGFVTMATLSDAEHAAAKLAGRLFMGRAMRYVADSLNLVGNGPYSSVFPVFFLQRVELSGPGIDTHTMNAKHSASKAGYQIHVSFVSTFPVSTTFVHTSYRR